MVRPYRTPTEFTVVKGESEQRHSFPHVLLRAEHNFNFVNSIGLKFEAEHVQECLAQDLKESPVMPHARSLAVMDILDEFFAQWAFQLEEGKTAGKEDASHKSNIQ